MKELKDEEQVSIIDDDRIDVESGEGIERFFWPFFAFVVIGFVESGEGIERSSPGSPRATEFPRVGGIR